MRQIIFIIILLIIGSTSVIASDKEVVSDKSSKSWGEDNVKRYLSPPTISDIVKDQNYFEVEAVVSAYNSVPEQTDETPCIGAGGNICGRNDIVACPRSYNLRQELEIDGKRYICLDRMNKRYESEIMPHFDIFMGEDIERALNFGRQTKTIKIIK